MKVREVFIGVVVAIFMYLVGTAVEKQPCACGDLPEQDSTIKEVKAPAI